MAKIWAIHSGGDWADAGADYLILPEGMDIATEKLAWTKWYRSVYCSKLNTSNKVEYQTFGGWLVARGAKEPTADQLEIFEDL